MDACDVPLDVPTDDVGGFVAPDPRAGDALGVLLIAGSVGVAPVGPVAFVVVLVLVVLAVDATVVAGVALPAELDPPELE